MNINSINSAASQPASSKRDISKQIDAINKEIENYKKQLEKIDSQDISQDTKDAKKKLIQEKINQLNKEITKLQSEQLKETVNTTPKNNTKNNMSKEEYEAMKLIEAGVSVELSKDLSLLAQKYKSENGNNKIFLNQDKDREGNETFTAEKIRASQNEENSDTPAKRKKAAWDKMVEEFTEAGLFEEYEDQLRYELEQMDFGRINEELPVRINLEKLYADYDEHKILASARESVVEKKSFLQKTVEKTEKAINALSSSAMGKMAEANNSVNDLKETSKEADHKDGLEINDYEEFELEEDKLKKSVDISL